MTNKEKVMTNNEALKRALTALHKAHDETEAFDYGGMSSGEIVDTIGHELYMEFKQKDEANER